MSLPWKKACRLHGNCQWISIEVRISFSYITGGFLPRQHRNWLVISKSVWKIYVPNKFLCRLSRDEPRGVPYNSDIQVSICSPIRLWIKMSPNLQQQVLKEKHNELYYLLRHTVVLLEISIDLNVVLETKIFLFHGRIPVSPVQNSSIGSSSMRACLVFSCSSPVIKCPFFSQPLSFYVLKTTI